MPLSALSSCLYDLLFRPSTTPDDSPCTSTPRPVHLPLEIVIHILEQAYHTDDRPRHLLRQCALVCRDWSSVAQLLLFRSVALSSRTAGAAFLAAVDRATPRGRMFGDAVRRLKVVLDHNQPFGLSQESFAHAVTACPNLTELNLALYGAASPGRDEVGLPDVLRMRRPAPSFDEPTLALLRAGPRIRTLHFSNWSENNASVIQLLGVWPSSLKALAVSGTPPKLPPTTSLAPFPCALDELRMNCQSPVSVDFMKWLLHNSAQSLRTLELKREQPPELLDYLVESHRGSLRSLALPTCTMHDQAHAVHKCAALRELRIEHPWVTPVLYKSLPAHLEHLALAIDQDTGLQPVLDVVRSADPLKAVTLQVWDSGERNPQLPVLKLACAFRGIDLEITKDVQVFRSVVRRDSPFSRIASEFVES